MLDADQLNRERRRGAALHGFREAPLGFPPTFKYDPNKRERRCEYSRKRVPSYADRVLFHSLPSRGVRVAEYDAAKPLCTSDHAPVYASCEVDLPKVLDHLHAKVAAAAAAGGETAAAAKKTAGAAAAGATMVKATLRLVNFRVTLDDVTLRQPKDANGTEPGTPDATPSRRNSVSLTSPKKDNATAKSAAAADAKTAAGGKKDGVSASDLRDALRRLAVAAGVGGAAGKYDGPPAVCQFTCEGPNGGGCGAGTWWVGDPSTRSASAADGAATPTRTTTDPRTAADEADGTLGAQTVVEVVWNQEALPMFALGPPPPPPTPGEGGGEPDASGAVAAAPGAGTKARSHNAGPHTTA